MLLTAALPLLLSSCAGNRTILGDDHSVKGTVKGAVIDSADKNAQSQIIWFVKPEGDSISYAPISRPYRKPVDPAVTAGANDEMTASMRQVQAAVDELLKGPSETEEAIGLGSEIPKGTVLIAVSNVKDEPGIVLDLSKRFISGSGASSFEIRMEQLKRTVNEVVNRNGGHEDVYLNVEGARLTQATGDGIDVPQPINR